MMGKTTVLKPNFCVDELQALQPWQVVGTLQQLEAASYASATGKSALGGREAAAALLPLLANPNWVVKAKTLITLGRIGDASLGPKLLVWLKNQELPCWQLQAMDAWFQLQQEPSLGRQKAAELLVWAKEPIAIRGSVWLLCQFSGFESAKLLGKFITSKKAWVIKDEFLADCWFRLSKTLTVGEFAEIEGENPNLRPWLKYRDWDDSAVYGLYPNPDYLWQLSKEQGLSQKEFKSLYFKPRHKKTC